MLSFRVHSNHAEQTELSLETSLLTLYPLATPGRPPNTS